MSFKMITPSQIVIALLCGAFTWTFIEYCFHRWLGHDARFRPNFFSNEHVRHHSEGDYFSPVWKKALMAGVVLTLLGTPAFFIASWLGLIFIIGLVLAYLYYELFHFAHHVHSGFISYDKKMRRHHFYHHFMNPRANHGVTSPLWDFIFRTYESPQVIRVPERLKMRWLTDPSSGEIYPEFTQWYELKRRHNKTKTPQEPNRSVTGANRS